MALPRYGRIRRLVAIAARCEGVSPAALLSQSREHSLARVRFAVYDAARGLGYSYAQIARQLNRRDHTTVMYGIQRAKELRAGNPDFAELCGILEAEARA